MVNWLNFTTFDIIGDLAFGEPFGCLELACFSLFYSTFPFLRREGRKLAFEYLETFRYASTILSISSWHYQEYGFLAVVVNPMLDRSASARTAGRPSAIADLISLHWNFSCRLSPVVNFDSTKIGEQKFCPLIVQEKFDEIHFTSLLTLIIKSIILYPVVR